MVDFRQKWCMFAKQQLMILKDRHSAKTLTRMEPPSVNSKLMTDDEKICSSGLYVTNWACDSLHSHNRARVAICGH